MTVEPESNGSTAEGTGRATRTLSWLLFAVLFVTFAYFFHAEAGWNVNSRICLTYALVEKRAFAIDNYQRIEALKTEDLAFFDGHYYSDKIIGTSLLGAAPMTVLHLISRAIGRDFSWNVKRYVVTTFSVSLLGALAGVVLYRLLLFFGASAAGAFFLVLAFVFGTQVFSVSTVFLSYAPALCFEILSYAVLAKHREGLDSRRLFIAGLALGAALLCEYTVGIVAVGLSVYAMFHLKQKRSIVWYWLGAAVPLLPFLGYTMASFGRPTIPYQYSVNPEFKEGMSQGFQGIVGFNPAVLYYITIHRYRGLFYHSPFLALAVWGWIAMWRDPNRRSDAMLSISMTAAYLVFNASYYMWWGGWTNGPRHLIPALPFLVGPLTWVWGGSRTGQTGQTGRTGRTVLIVLFAVSFFFNTIPALVDAQIRQGYQAVELYHPRLSYNYRDPLWELGIKEFWRGRIAANAGQCFGLRGLWSLAPLVLVWALAGTATFRLANRRRRTSTVSNPQM
jgi:hypothetical protein